MNRSDEMPLTHFLDKLSDMCERNQLNIEELGQYRGLCAIEATMLESDLHQITPTDAG